MGLDSIELVFAIEDEFGIEIPAHDVGHLATVGEMADYLCARVGAAEPDARAAVWTRLVDVVERVQGLDRSRIVPEARFIRDLGVD